jgi:hypothetical protein
MPSDLWYNAHSYPGRILWSYEVQVCKDTINLACFRCVPGFELVCFMCVLRYKAFLGGPWPYFALCAMLFLLEKRRRNLPFKSLWARK